jgi:Uncharacterised nucleotidyltransferase
VTRKEVAALVFQSLHSPPRQDAVVQFAKLRSADVAKVLLHLDQTGLALYLLNHLLEYDLYSLLAQQLQDALNQRLEKNQARSEDMFHEFSRVVTALDSAHVNYAVMKGFSLVPEYSPAIYLRHQTDIDIQIDAASTDAAHWALDKLDYGLESHDVTTGEIKFVRQLGRQFMGRNDIYALQSTSRVELHQRFWEPRVQVVLDFAQDPLSRRILKTVRNVSFPILAEEDRFVGQLLHAFRHFLTGWIRSSWLFEIASFIRAHCANQMLWDKVGNDRYPERVAHACGFILLLCRQLLEMSIPERLQETFIAPIPPHLCLWVELYGSKWAAADMKGSKLNLMIHKHFVPDPRSWRKQYASLLFPRRAPAVSLESRAHGEAAVNWRRRQAEVFCQRASFHFLRNIEYAVHSLRWRYALLELERLKPRYG